jgi:hypothetical protein
MNAIAATRFVLMMLPFGARLNVSICGAGQIDLPQGFDDVNWACVGLELEIELNHGIA